MIDEGSVNTTAIGFATAIGMTVYRNDLVWNNGTGVAIEGKPGVYSSSMLSHLQAVVAALKAASITPLIVVTPTQTPALCPTLTTALSNGSIHTSIVVTQLAFAITSGDTIVITNPANPSQFQNLTAAANMAAGGSGTLSVTSFTANAAYPVGAWVYDSTNWNACTPKHLANTMAYLVAQTGLQGVHWELINEPDGDVSGTTATLLTQMMQLAYPAMKAADSTCVVHGLTLEHCAPAGYTNGMDFYNACVSAGIVGYYDIISVHEYNDDASINTDASPDSINYWGCYMAQLFSNFRANMLAKSDSVPMWITECNWPRTGGTMTPFLQAQYLRIILQELSGQDWTNGVAFSEYIKAFCVYQMYGSADGNWGLYPADFPGPYVNPQPAVAVLTNLVSGT
jgi:hypothetical protein